MANRFLSAANDGERVIPPTDPHERVRFWIQRGNQLLLEQGCDHLTWAHANGHYFIEPRRT